MTRSSEASFGEERGRVGRSEAEGGRSLGDVMKRPKRVIFCFAPYPVSRITSGESAKR